MTIEEQQTLAGQAARALEPEMTEEERGLRYEDSLMWHDGRVPRVRDIDGAKMVDFIPSSDPAVVPKHGSFCSADSWFKWFPFRHGIGLTVEKLKSLGFEVQEIAK